jgi:co-chaperonin GroES (HSP10)
MIKPIKKNVLVELQEKSKETESGIILTVADRDEVSKGLVVEIGPDVTEVKIGDMVMPNWSAARKVSYIDKEYYIVPEEEIFIVFE